MSTKNGLPAYPGAPSFDQQWQERLAAQGIHVELADAETVWLRSVPTDPRSFSKPESGLLIRRPRRGLPFWTFVDDDLEYRGADVNLTRLFAGGVTRQGWRLVQTSTDTSATPGEAVEEGLAMLGARVSARSASGDDVSSVSSTPPASLLGSLGTNLTELLRTGSDGDVLFRDDEIDEATSIVTQLEPQPLIVEGGPGTGKQNLAWGLAARLRRLRPEWQVVSVNLGLLFAGSAFEADRDNVLKELVTRARDEKTVLVLENVDLAFREAPHARFLLLDAGGARPRVVGLTCLKFAASNDSDPLFRVLQLRELSRGQTVEVLARVWPSIAEHNHLETTFDSFEDVVDTSIALPGQLPGKAVQLLNLAASRAAVLGESSLDVIHVYLAAEKATG